jgi:hypothetical protein
MIAAMASVFTEHVRHFSTGSDPAEKVLPELKKLLRQRMRRRNLLSAPPSYLGYDPGSWDAQGAFEDIVVDCYVFAVLDRLKGLRNQLRVRGNIDGLIVRNVDNFLLERQRHHDPVGYAVFGNVEGAACRAETAGEVAVEGRNRGRLHNPSILRLDQAQPSADPVEPRFLQEALEQAPGWDHAVSSLIATTEEGQEWVTRFIHRLQDAGIPAVRCGDLVAVIAGRARESWATRHAVPRGELAYEGEDHLGKLVRMVCPDQRLEDRARWERLKQKMALRIEGLGRQERVRERLTQVFAGLVQLIEEGDSGPPKQAELIDRLGIARATVSDDFRLLKGILEELLHDENPES